MKRPLALKTAIFVQKKADIFIAGGGFCGTVLTHYLSRQVRPGTRIVLAHAGVPGPGTAYATFNPSHLLNVRTGRMGALQENPKHFLEWLQSEPGRAVIRHFCPGYAPDADNYAPRVLYGAYLEVLHAASLAEAAQRGVEVVHLQGSASAAVRNGSGLTVSVQEESIACDSMVLAVGPGTERLLGESGALFLQLKTGEAAERIRGMQHIVLVGSGLTAIDVLLTLDDAKFEGEITLISRHGLWPCAHPQIPPHPREPSAEILAQKTALGMLHALRQAAAKMPWHSVIDGLRPHTQAWWQSLPREQQRKVFARLFSFWNVHRHRMAPEVAERIHGILRRGNITHYTGQVKHVVQVGNTWGALVEPFHGNPAPSRMAADLIINCTGPSYGSVMQSSLLLRSLAAGGLVEEHPSGAGIKLDAKGCTGEGIYALGALGAGQWLESTAVPELRAQAAALAVTLTA